MTAEGTGFAAPEGGVGEMLCHRSRMAPNPCFVDLRDGNGGGFHVRGGEQGLPAFHLKPQ